MLRAVWKHRKVILHRARYNLLNKYSGSIMGKTWGFLQPLIQILIYTIVFSEIMSMKLPGIKSGSGFAIYLCAGLLPWMAFSEGLSKSSSSLIDNGTYLKKLPTPEIVFIAENVTASFYSGVISLSLLYCITIFLDFGTYITWLVVPLIYIIFMVFCFGISIVLGVLNTFFRDLGQLLSVLLQAWMWLTPIVYVKEILPQEYIWLLKYNPLYWFINSFQKAIAFNNWPGAVEWLVMLLLAVVSIAAGLIILKKFEKEIRDVI